MPKPDCARHQLLLSFWLKARECAAVLDVSPPELADRGHRSLVWDASAMPAGGHYFPIYARLLAELELTGEISPDRDILVETSTGTAGMALGWLARRLGYRVILFMPSDMPPHRIEAVREQLPDDAELKFSPAGAYVGGMVREFRKFMLEHRETYKGRRIYPLDHSRRPEAVDALARLLKEDILPSLALPHGLQFAVGALGNGTSSAALFKAARSVDPNVRTVGVEPLEAPVGYERKYGAAAVAKLKGDDISASPHALIGTGGWGVHFPFFDVDAIDEIVPVAAQTWRAEQQAAADRGLDLGNSSAACQAVALRMLETPAATPRTAFSIRYDLSGLY